MVLEEIRSKTNAAHKRLEENSRLSKVMQECITIEEYQSLLERFYGFIYPIEHKLKQLTALSEYIPDIEERSKATLIEKDLCHLSASTLINEIPLCTDLPQTADLSAAFGYLYVIEGSTLGGKLISDKLLKNLNCGRESGAAYFNNYGEKRGQMWKTFINYLNNYSSIGTADTIVATAENTFIKLEEWLNHQ